jgi:hypothetical protein
VLSCCRLLTVGKRSNQGTELLCILYTMCKKIMYIHVEMFICLFVNLSTCRSAYFIWRATGHILRNLMKRLCHWRSRRINNVLTSNKQVIATRRRHEFVRLKRHYRNYKNVVSTVTNINNGNHRKHNNHNSVKRVGITGPPKLVFGRYLIRISPTTLAVRDSTSLCSDCSLPKTFPFICHPTTWHYILVV